LVLCFVLVLFRMSCCAEYVSDGTGATVKAEIKSAHAVVGRPADRQQKKTIHGMLQLSAVQSDKVEASPDPDPIDVVVVVDVSGSMEQVLRSGEGGLGAVGSRFSHRISGTSMDVETRLTLVKDGLDWMARSLGAESRMGVVQFDDDARVINPLVPLSTQRQELLASCSKLKTHGRTNLFSGILLGARMLMGLSDTSSDGTDTKIADLFDETVVVSEHDRSRVLVVMTDGHTNVGHRNTQIAQLMQNDPSWANIELWMMPISDGADAQGCDLIARSVGGLFAAVDTVEGISGALGTLCGSERGIRNCTLRLCPEEGTTGVCIRTRSVLPTTEGSDTIARLGVLSVGTSRAILWDMDVTPPAESDTTSSVITATIEGTTSEPFTLRLTFSIRWGPVDADPHSDVLIVSMREKIAQTLAKNDFAAAKLMLSEVMKHELAADLDQEVAVLKLFIAEYESGHSAERMMKKCYHVSNEMSHNRHTGSMVNYDNARKKALPTRSPLAFQYHAKAERLQMESMAYCKSSSDSRQKPC